MKTKHSYGVTIGNIGNALATTNLREAEETYKEYVEQSKSGIGRACGENVILWRDGEPWKEYKGSLSVMDMIDEQGNK